MSYSSTNPCVELEGISVDARYASIAIDLLKKQGLYLSGIKALKLGPRVAIPVKDVEEAINYLRERGIHVEKLRACFPQGRVRHRVTFKELLKRVLDPRIVDRIPKSYDIVGDIILIDLEPDIAKQYGSLIAEALMEIHPNVRAVYARGATIGEERIRELYHIGGETKTKTVHREYGIRICVDIAKAYYNPSLATEHHRIAMRVKDSDIVLDLFTGVGPFALHIARRTHAYVVACDINRHAISLLKESIELNRLKGLIEPIVIDSIRALENHAFGESKYDTIIMNLPHRALDLICHALAIAKTRGEIHVYTVASTSEEVQASILSKTKECSEFQFHVLEIRHVLDYAPHRSIYRVTILKL